MVAPSYIAAIVAVLMGVQNFLGLDFAPEEWNTALLVIVGLVVAFRQVITGRATPLGMRPKG